MEDGRRNNGGNRNAGRKKGIGVANDIRKYCEYFIKELLQDDAIKLKATKQLSVNIIDQTEDYFYILKNENKYKLGFTSDIKKRHSNYKAHLGYVNIIYIYKGYDANDIESYLHSKYNSKRIVGEYFQLSKDDILNIISYCSLLNIK